MITEYNWLKTNIRDRLTDNLVDFKATITPYHFNELTFEQACYKTACSIRNNYPKIYLAFSGGLDSVFVFNTFVKHNIPFTPCIIYAKGNISNAKEVRRAIDLCTKNHIIPKVFPITEKEYFQLYLERVYRPIRGYGIFSPHQFLIVDRAIQDNAVVVYAEHMINDRPESNVELLINEYDFYSDLATPEIGIPFFLYSLEVVNAMIKFSIDNKIVGEELKNRLYNDYTPKAGVEFLTPEVQQIKNYYALKLMNEKKRQHLFGSAKGLYQYLAPWRNL